MSIDSLDPVFGQNALASEQLFRVGEAAVSSKTRSLGIRKKSTFEKRVNWLTEKGVLTSEEGGLWHALRELRNTASHPKEQAIFTPAQALSVLSRTAHMVNRLFG